MKFLRNSFIAFALIASGFAQAQSAIIRGEASAGVYENLKSINQVLQVGSSFAGNQATYYATTGVITPAATPTDVLTIQGSSTKTIRVMRISISGIQTTAGITPIQVFRRTAADTGGTPVAVTALLADTNNAAATGAVKYYTANPTGLGAGVAGFSSYVSFNSALGTSAGEETFVFNDLGTQALDVRGTTQYIAVNLGGATITGLTCVINVEWTEE